MRYALLIAVLAALLCIGAAHAAPDPVATNNVTLIGSDGHEFRYAINVAASASSAAAPDCYGNVTLTLCGRHVTGVTWTAGDVGYDHRHHQRRADRHVLCHRPHG